MQLLLPLDNCHKMKRQMGWDFWLEGSYSSSEEFALSPPQEMQISTQSSEVLLLPCHFPCNSSRTGWLSICKLTFIFGQKKKDNLFNPTVSFMRHSFLHQFCAPEGKELFKASSLTWILCDVIASRAWKSMRSNGKSLSLGRYASCSAKACCHGYISV